MVMACAILVPTTDLGEMTKKINKTSGNFV